MDIGNRHVNPHYLDHVLDLSSATDVEAGEDIYSDKGLKLLSKGARLDPGMQDRLIRHKLAKPLETSISLGSAFDATSLHGGIERLMQHSSYRRIVGDDHAKTIRSLFDSIDTRQPGLDLLLALTQRVDEESQQQIQLSAILAVRLGLENQLGAAELRALALAGLLHEIGHLYLAPTLRDKNAHHSLAAWRQLVAQPLIGGMALSHLQNLSETTKKAVREQFERVDGSGYPAGVQGSMLEMGSQLFSVASMTARLLLSHGDSGLWQAHIAMQLVPGEYSRTVSTGLMQVVQDSQIAMALPNELDDPLALPALFAHIAQLQATLLELEDRFATSSKAAGLWIRRMNQRLFTIQRTFSTTGIDSLASAGPSGQSIEIRTEVVLISREIRRRLRDMGKTAVLQVAPLSPQMQEAVTPWLESLLAS